ncbi:MAG: DUF6498-containing protein [Crocinitomicaceae bacterium]
MSVSFDIKWKSLGVISLIAVNLIILSFAILFDWTLYDIIFSYWLENFVIGFYNIFKLYKVDGGNPEDHYVTVNGNKRYVPPIKTPFVIFFILHFFAFWYIHGYFIQDQFNVHNLLYKTDYGYNFIKLLDWPTVIALTGLFISHGVSYFKNFLRKKEYVGVAFSSQMWVPYKRIVIVHGIFWLVAMYSIHTTGSQPVLISFIIIGKILIDLKLYSNRHSA